MITLCYIVLFLFVFVCGACIGSFLNVLIYRVPNHIQFVRGRSFCPNCKTTLQNRDLIPLLSFLLLRGKCRSCGQKISPRYPAIEALMGLLATLAAWRFGYTLDFWIAFATSAILLTAAMIDLDTLTIPNGIILALFVPAIASMFTPMPLLDHAIGALAVSLPMFLLLLAIPDCFGGADVKLMFVCGFLLGWQNTLLAAFLAILTGGIYAVYLLVGRKKGRKEHFAFGPFLAFGVWVALLYGEKLIAVYLGAFGIGVE